MVSRPTWRVYAVRSKSWSRPPKTISTCSTSLPSPSRRLSIRERTTRPPSWAIAKRSVAPAPIRAVRCWSAVVVVGQVLDRGEPEDGARAQVDLARAAEERLRHRLAGRAADRRPGRHELLDERRLGPLVEPDEGPRQERPLGRPDRPAQDDRALEAHAGGHVEVDPLAPEAAREPGQLLVGGERRGGERLADAGRVAGQRRPERLECHAALGEAGGEGEAGDPVLAELDDPVGAVGDVAGRGRARRRSPTYGRAPKRSAARKSTYVV